MNNSKIMTVGAVGFAGFALWYITRKPGGQVAKQSGQQARDSGLQAWLNQQITPDNWMTASFAQYAAASPINNVGALFGGTQLFGI